MEVDMVAAFWDDSPEGTTKVDFWGESPEGTTEIDARTVYWIWRKIYRQKDGGGGYEGWGPGALELGLPILNHYYR